MDVLIMASYQDTKNIKNSLFLKLHLHHHFLSKMSPVSIASMKLKKDQNQNQNQVKIKPKWKTNLVNWIELNWMSATSVDLIFCMFCKRRLLQNFCNYYRIKVLKLDCQIIMYELANWLIIQYRSLQKWYLNSSVLLG